MKYFHEAQLRETFHSLLSFDKNERLSFKYIPYQVKNVTLIEHAHLWSSNYLLKKFLKNSKIKFVPTI